MSEEVVEAGDVHLVGTAHVSEASVEEVREEIETRDPDVVAVELDEGRYRQLEGDEPEDLDPRDLLEGNTVFQFLAYWLLSYVQTRLGERFDIEPGADMKAAVDAAEERGIEVALVDRDIRTTVQRFWTRLSTVEKLQLVAALAGELGSPWTVGLGVGFGVGVMIGSVLEMALGPLFLPSGPWIAGTVAPTGIDGIAVGVLDGLLLAGAIALLVAVPVALALSRLGGEEDPEEFDVERLTDTDVVSAMIEEFREFSPRGAEALIDERDAYIAHRLLAVSAAGESVVAVVGAGHVEGIRGYLDDPDSLPPMETIEGKASGRRFSIVKAVGYLTAVAVIGFFALLVLAGVEDTFLLKLFVSWFLINGILAGGLALAAGAHPESAAVGGLIAWFTSVDVTLAPGWFAGYVELKKRPVSVSDIGDLNEILADEESPIRDVLGRMLEVPLFRLIAVVAMTNVGSMLGTGLFFAVVVPWLATDIGGTHALMNHLLDGAREGASVLLEAVR